MKLVLLNRKCEIREVKEYNEIPGHLIVKLWNRFSSFYQLNEYLIAFKISLSESHEPLVFGLLNKDTSTSFKMLCMVIFNGFENIDIIVKRVISRLKDIFKEVICDERCPRMIDE